MKRNKTRYAKSRAYNGSGVRLLLDSDIVQQLLPKEDMSQAIGYLNNHWSALQVYVSRSDVAIGRRDRQHFE